MSNRVLFGYEFAEKVNYVYYWSLCSKAMLAIGAVLHTRPTKTSDLLICQRAVRYNCYMFQGSGRDRA